MVLLPLAGPLESPLDRSLFSLHSTYANNYGEFYSPSGTFQTIAVDGPSAIHVTKEGIPLVLPPLAWPLGSPLAMCLLELYTLCCG